MRGALLFDEKIITDHRRITVLNDCAKNHCIIIKMIFMFMM